MFRIKLPSLPKVSLPALPKLKNRLGKIPSLKRRPTIVRPERFNRFNRQESLAEFGKCGLRKRMKRLKKSLNFQSSPELSTFSLLPIQPKISTAIDTSKITTASRRFNKTVLGKVYRTRRARRDKGLKRYVSSLR
jgi:hypothetical protein